MKTLCFSLVLALGAVVPAFAHGNKKHVMGTLEKVTASAVVVKTTNGKSVEVKLSPTTIYVDKDGKSAKFADLVTGQRVVIHATPKGSDLIANEVKFAPLASAASAASSPHH
ncbi:MAG TPA: hypothetical protein VLX32_14420 [Candidatus Acidoferrum sp.]|nr:hypothetical protein [Candidatus Acidoferrum sp.]